MRPKRNQRRTPRHIHEAALMKLASRPYAPPSWMPTMSWTAASGQHRGRPPGFLERRRHGSIGARSRHRPAALPASVTPHTFSISGLPSRPVGRKISTHDQDGEGGNVLVFGAEISRPESLDQVRSEAAEHRAGQRADTAEHRGGERLDARDEAHEEVDIAVAAASPSGRRPRRAPAPITKVSEIVRSTFDAEQRRHLHDPARRRAARGRASVRRDQQAEARHQHRRSITTMMICM